MPYDPIQGQGHGGPKVAKMANFEVCLLRHISSACRPNQWSNYEGARGGLAPLKDRAAPSKHLVREGTKKAP